LIHIIKNSFSFRQAIKRPGFRKRLKGFFIYIFIAKADYPKPIVARGKDLKKFPAG